ncbi:hypothetical protein F4678DRAFT_467558 [Xylaria arbuscula]|nr:hypothetical protein F4678DRAFT_467558 [Xylaria arbuscula]
MLFDTKERAQTLGQVHSREFQKWEEARKSTLSNLEKFEASGYSDSYSEYMFKIKENPQTRPEFIFDNKTRETKKNTIKKTRGVKKWNTKTIKTSPPKKKTIKPGESEKAKKERAEKKEAEKKEAEKKEAEKKEAEKKEAEKKEAEKKEAEKKEAEKKKAEKKEAEKKEAEKKKAEKKEAEKKKEAEAEAEGEGKEKGKKKGEKEEEEEEEEEEEGEEEGEKEKKGEEEGKGEGEGEKGEKSKRTTNTGPKQFDTEAMLQKYPLKIKQHQVTTKTPDKFRIKDLVSKKYVQATIHYITGRRQLFVSMPGRNKRHPNVKAAAIISTTKARLAKKNFLASGGPTGIPRNISSFENFELKDFSPLMVGSTVKSKHSKRYPETAIIGKFAHKSNHFIFTRLSLIYVFGIEEIKEMLAKVRVINGTPHPQKALEERWLNDLDLEN